MTFTHACLVLIFSFSSFHVNYKMLVLMSQVSLGPLNRFIHNFLIGFNMARNYFANKLFSFVVPLLLVKYLKYWQSRTSFIFRQACVLAEKWYQVTKVISPKHLRLKNKLLNCTFRNGGRIKAYVNFDCDFRHFYTKGN